VVDEAERAKNRTKSKVRAKVEHSIGVIKRLYTRMSRLIPSQWIGTQC